MNKVIVLGATGGTGSVITAELVKRGMNIDLDPLSRTLEKKSGLGIQKRYP